MNNHFSSNFLYFPNLPLKVKNNKAENSRNIPFRKIIILALDPPLAFCYFVCIFLFLNCQALNSKQFYSRFYWIKMYLLLQKVAQVTISKTSIELFTGIYGSKTYDPLNLLLFLRFYIFLLHWLVLKLYWFSPAFCSSFAPPFPSHDHRIVAVDLL